MTGPLKKLLIVEQILSVSTFNRKCMENSVENMHTNVRRNNHQLTQLLIVKQILLVSTLENVWEQYEEYAYWCSD